jgi:hypothetical protein
MKMRKYSASSVSFSDASNVATVRAVAAPISATHEVKPQGARFHSYEVFLAGFIASAILAFFFGYIVTLLYRFSGVRLYSFDINSFVIILVNPGPVFLVLYFWGKRRVVPYFREKYRHISVLLFSGSAVGYGVTEQVFLFALGATAVFPTFLSIVFTVLGFILSAVANAFTVTFVGLAALTIAYFRHAKEH